MKTNILYLIIGILLTISIGSTTIQNEIIYTPAKPRFTKILYSEYNPENLLKKAQIYCDQNGYQIKLIENRSYGSSINIIVLEKY